MSVLFPGGIAATTNPQYIGVNPYAATNTNGISVANNVLETPKSSLTQEQLNLLKKFPSEIFKTKVDPVLLARKTCNHYYDPALHGGKSGSSLAPGNNGKYVCQVCGEEIDMDAYETLRAQFSTCTRVIDQVLQAIKIFPGCPAEFVNVIGFTLAWLHTFDECMPGVNSCFDEYVNKQVYYRQNGYGGVSSDFIAYNNWTNQQAAQQQINNIAAMYNQPATPVNPMQAQPQTIINPFAQQQAAQPVVQQAQPQPDINALMNMLAQTTQDLAALKNQMQSQQTTTVIDPATAATPVKPAEPTVQYVPK